MAYPCTAREKSEADRVTRESLLWARVETRVPRRKKKRKKEKERKKSGKKIDGGRGGKLAKLSNDPRYDDYLDSLVIGNNGRRSNEGPTDKKVIDTDTEYYEFKNPWILYRSLSYGGINLRIYLDDLFPIFSFRQQVYESAKSHRDLPFLPFSFLPPFEEQVISLLDCGARSSSFIELRNVGFDGSWISLCS